MDDYIDRSMTLKAIKESVCDVFNIASNAGRMYQKIKQIVETVPAADVAPVVHGKWEMRDIWICNSDGKPVAPVGVEYVCSVCGRSEDNMEPYCHCGAKMYGGTA